MDLYKVLSENLRELRKEKGLSQIELGSLAGVSNKYISEIERGDAFPSADILNQLADALKVPPTELVFDEEIMIYRLNKRLKTNKN